MKICQEPIADRQTVLTIEVDEEQMDHALRQAARQLSQRVKIRGFRPGKAPYAVVARAVGEERCRDQALRLLGPRLYKEALAESGIEPYALPPLEVTQRQPPIFQATIPLLPLVEPGDYHAIRVAPQEATVTDEEVDAVLAEIQQDNAQLVPVERAVATDDLLILSLRVRHGDQTLLEREKIVFDMAEGSKDLPPEFGEALLGMERGQEREVTLPYPVGHPDERLAGQVATIHVALHEVKERHLPEVDDELAQTVGDFETLDELRERARANLQTRRDLEARERLAEEVLAAVMAQARVEFPPLMVERELDKMIADHADRLRRRGLTLEKALRMEGKREQDLRDDLRAQARERVSQALVLGKVVELEGIELEPSEVEEEAEAIAQGFGRRAKQAREALASEEPRRFLASRLLAQNALRRLVEIATSGEVKTNTESTP